MQVILVATQPTLLGIIAAFFLFRIFDIVKPPPANRAQKLPRGYGVVVDDFIAGIYARLVMLAIAAFYSGVGDFWAI